MATTTFTVTHNRASDYKGESYDSTRLVTNKIAAFFQGLGGGVYQGDSIAVSQDPATATVTLSGAVGTASSGTVTLTGVLGLYASGTVTLTGGAGDVTIVVNGTSVGPVAFNATDAQTALDCITALNANGTVAAIVTATDGGSGVVLITSNSPGAIYNNITLTASRTAGAATASGPTLEGGADGSVGVTVNGTLVTTDTAGLDDDTAATAVAAELEADATLGPLLSAVANTNVVTITWGTEGVAGDAITLSSTSVSGTATASGATLGGGADNDVTVTVGGVAVVTDTTALSDDAGATAVAAAINADAGASALVTASAASAVVTLTAVDAGTGGNGISLSSATDTGTATASGANLSGGTETTYTL